MIEAGQYEEAELVKVVSFGRIRERMSKVCEVY